MREQELQEAELEERKGDIAQARLLHDAVKNKGIVAEGIKDVQRARQGLEQALDGVQQEQQSAMLAARAAAKDRERVRVDMAQTQALRFAAAEHKMAAGHLAEGEKAAASEAKGLVERAKGLLTFASEEKQAAEDAAQVQRLDAQASTV
jgi:hypothetical protein